MNKMNVHLFFEQSGTFKNEFKALGYTAYDYDILNDYGETDFNIDLFSEIEKAHAGGAYTVFDSIKKDDLIFAFFPCTYFSTQQRLHYMGNNYHHRSWDFKKKLENAMTLHDQLNHHYKLIMKLIIVCIDRQISLIIENPYHDNYLNTFSPLKPAIVDLDRRANEDDFKKPTQYFFYNLKPKNNLIFEPRTIKERATILNVSKKRRNLISPEYARRFIREYII